VIGDFHEPYGAVLVGGISLCDLISVPSRLQSL
jgi:hypothetical protein